MESYSYVRLVPYEGVNARRESLGLQIRVEVDRAFWTQLKEDDELSSFMRQYTQGRIANEAASPFHKTAIGLINRALTNRAKFAVGQRVLFERNREGRNEVDEGALLEINQELKYVSDLIKDIPDLDPKLSELLYYLNALHDGGSQPTLVLDDD